jgi:hypothetical protein
MTNLKARYRTVTTRTAAYCVENDVMVSVYCSHLEPDVFDLISKTSANSAATPTSRSLLEGAI